MAEIPGWAYLGSGIAMALFSKFIESKTQPGQLKLFFWIGVGFALIGVVKIGFNLLSKDKKPKTPKMPALQQPIRNLAQQPAQQQAQQALQMPRPSHSAHSQQHQAHRQAQQANQRYYSEPHHIAPAPKEQVNPQPTILTCSSCGAKHYEYANYCMRCGTRLK